MDRSLYLSGIDQDNCINVYDCIDKKLIFNKQVPKGEVFGIHQGILLTRYDINEIHAYSLNSSTCKEEFLKYTLVIENFKPNKLKIYDHFFVYVDDDITYYDFNSGVIISMGLCDVKYNIQDLTFEKLALTQGTSLSVYDSNFYTLTTFEMGTKFMYPKFLDPDNILISDGISIGRLNISSGDFYAFIEIENQRIQLSSDKKLIALFKQKTLTKVYDIAGNELDVSILVSMYKSNLSFNENIAIFNSQDSVVILDLHLNRILFEIPVLAEDFETDFTNILAIKTRTCTELWNLNCAV